MNEILNLLLVEDNEDDAQLLQEMLIEAEIECHVQHVMTMKDAKLHLSIPNDFDLILLDLNLPDSHGLETVFELTSAAQSLPIVVLTGMDNEELSYAAIQAGAQDYLVKGQIDITLLKRTLYHSRYRFQIVNKINAETELKKAYLATHDVLTGLPAEQVFLEQLQHSISKCEACKRTFAVILIKVHELAKIEQNYSALARDRILRTIARNLTKGSSHGMKVYRFKEIIFSVILYHVENVENLTTYIQSIQHKLTFKITMEDREYSPFYSIGSAIYPFDGSDIKQLLSASFISQERAKESGYNSFEIFNKNLENEPLKPFIFHSDILNAIQRNEFFLHYQPQLDLQNDCILGMEALVRWQHPELGIIRPDLFIPIAEEHKLITPLGEWLIQTVCAQMLEWQKKLCKNTFISIDVNISIQQLEFSNLYHYIKTVLKKYNILPQFLGIELTESIFLSEPEKIIQKLHDLKELGLKIAIDDFGKGYSSLSYLNHLPLDYLKLDLEFVKNINNSREKQSIVKSVIQLAHELNIQVIAEGVETREQLEWLKENNCDAMQGFFFSKPKPAKDIEKLLLR